MISNKDTGKNNLPPIVKEDEIDLVALSIHIWEGRMYIAKVCAVFIVLGLFLAVASPVKYQAGVKLIPESSKGFNLGALDLGALGGLAAQFGFGGASALNTESGTIPTDYYPEIIKSVPYLTRLMREPFEVNGIGQVTLYEYYHDYMGKSLIGAVAKYTVGLPGVIKKAFAGDEEVLVLQGDSGVTVLSMTKKEREVLEWLQENLTLSISKEIGMISITTEMPTAELAAQVASHAAKLLSDYAVSYKTEKVKEDLRFIEERYKEAEERFGQSQRALARFRDSNHGNLTSLARTEEQRLQSDYDLAFGLYNSLASQYEQARIKLQEETPVVKIIEPAIVPDEKSSPKRMMIMVVSVFLGCFVGIGLLFGKKIWGNFREQFRSYETIVSEED